MVTTPTPALPPPVEQVTADALRRLDERLPGLVTGLYLHGSLGFGEFFDGSDIDFVATTSRCAGPADVEALRAVHAELASAFPGTHYDGFYVLPGDLAAPPGKCPAVPGVRANLFEVGHHGDLILVTWHELARHGITVWGPDLTTLDIHTDDTALRASTLENMHSYWRGQVEAMDQHPHEASVPDAAVWGVLGTARLHHLLATGRLTSKSGAGRYALETFDPRWEPIVREALSVREGGRSTAAYADDAERRRLDTIAFMTEVVNDSDPSVR